MLRSLLATALLLLLPFTPVRAQSFGPGDNAVGLGLGFGGAYYSYGSYSGFRPTLSLQYDRGTAIPVGPGVLGIGGYFAYTNRRIYADYVYWVEDKRYDFWNFGIRGTYHWNDWHGLDNWDVYAGLGLGFQVTSITDRSTYSTAGYESLYARGFNPRSPLRSSLFVGSRYYFTEMLAVYAEGGYDVAFLTAGLLVRF